MANTVLIKASDLLTTVRNWANGKFLTSADIVSAYKIAGSKSASELTSSLLVSGNVGKVYNLSTALTITSSNRSLFVENADGSYPAGTNVAVVDASTTSTPDYKFDIMAGFIDTSAFLTQHQAVVNGGNTASWGQTVTVGTVGGTSLTFTMPENPNTDTHYTANLVAGGQSATSNATSDTADPYINTVENGAKSGGVQIKGGTNVSVTAKDGVVTIDAPDTDTHYTATPVLASTASGTSNATSDASDPYLNIVENGSKSGGVQIEGSGIVSVSAKDGKLTVGATVTVSDVTDLEFMTATEALAILEATS